MNNELGDLHKLLVTSYVNMMKGGKVEDPRILKEIRELLKDNEITGDVSAAIAASLEENTAVLPDDFLELVQHG
jgi:hypothetical protein